MAQSAKPKLLQHWWGQDEQSGGDIDAARERLRLAIYHLGLLIGVDELGPAGKERGQHRGGLRHLRVCLQVLVGGSCGIGGVGAEESADARREVSCEAVLDWIRGLTGEDGAAAGEARRGAVALVEAMTGLVSRTGRRWASRRRKAMTAEWMFVQKAYLCMSDAITNGEADDYTLKHGCAMLC